MIGFNPCTPCCKILTIRARIGACFTKNRAGNPEFPYESIRAEFFDDDDNSVFVIEDEYDEKTFEMPIGYKGKIRSVATGTSSKGDSFEVEQMYPSLLGLLLVDVSLTENYVCCNQTWIPRKLTGRIAHGDVNLWDYWGESGTYQGPIVPGGTIGSWWYTYSRLKYVTEIQIHTKEPFQIEYLPRWRFWAGYFKAITYTMEVTNYAYGGMADEDGTPLPGSSSSSGIIYGGFYLNLCNLSPNPLPFGVLNDQINGYSWDTSSGNYSYEDLINLDDFSQPLSFFGYIKTNINSQATIANESFVKSGLISTPYAGNVYNPFNPTFFGFKNDATISIS